MKMVPWLIAWVVPLFAAMPATGTTPAAQDDCPKHLNHRSTVEVVQSHLTAFLLGDATMLACDYAPDAVLILPGGFVPTGIVQGRANIAAVYASFFALRGGNVDETTTSLTISDDIAMLEYTVTSDHVSVSDGVDSFVSDKGQITAQTAYLGGFAVLP
jgi:ketosteroid isomerase-like protein